MGGANTVLQSELRQELTKPLDASDVMTPRGESMKAEIIHLRKLLHQISFEKNLERNSSDGFIEIKQFDTDIESNQQQQQQHQQQQQENTSCSPNFDDQEEREQRKHKDPHRILGVNEDEMKRNNAMRKLGITDVAYHEAEEILVHAGVARGGMSTPDDHQQSPGNPHIHRPKTEHILGYSEQQQHRTKAVRQILGTSESTIEAERAEELGRLGKDE